MSTSAISVPMELVDALGRRDFARVEECLASEVRFRALIPPHLCEANDAASVAGHLRSWFGGADELEMVASVVEPIASRVRMSYRLRLHDEDGWNTVEQQAYCDVVDGRISRIDLLCSGIWPEVPSTEAKLDGLGQNCATLTPLIRATLRDLASGQVLEVVADDPTAHGDVASWSRLSGNELVAAVAQQSGRMSFYIRKK